MSKQLDRITLACGCVIKHPGYYGIYRAMRYGLPLDVTLARPCTEHDPCDLAARARQRAPT